MLFSHGRDYQELVNVLQQEPRHWLGAKVIMCGVIVRLLAILTDANVLKLDSYVPPSAIGVILVV